MVKSSHLFPQSAGIYICQRDTDLILIVVKGICPTLKLDSGFDLGTYLRTRKAKPASKEILDNIEVFPEMWAFTSLSFLDYSVFSPIDYRPTGKLDLPLDTMADIRNKYYFLCQQGVPATKIMRALCQEFKVSMDTIINLINDFDKYANS